MNAVTNAISSGSKEEKNVGKKDGDQMKAEELRELIREVLREQEEEKANVGDKSATKLKTGSMSASQRVKTSRERIKKEKSDSFTYFYLGGALGFKGRFKLMQRNYLSSFVFDLLLLNYPFY